MQLRQSRPWKFALAACLASVTAHVWAEASRPLTIVVPFPPGGGTDIFARAIAPKLAARAGKPVIVENRTGAAGNIGADTVVRAAPDGNTILYTSSSIALSALSRPKPAFDPLRDLAPVSMTALIPLVLVVHPSVPANNVGELIALARRSPGALNFSSAGPGSAMHLCLELLRIKTNIDLNHIPYRGAAPAQVAVIAGEAQVSFLVPPLVLGHLKSGKLRALAISSAKRSPLVPDLPTLEEAGVAGYEALQWHGVFAPAKTPTSVIERLNAEVARALDSPDMQEHFAAEGAEKVSISPDQFARFLRGEVEKWAGVMKTAGISLE